jgi:hypothetical protein
MERAVYMPFLQKCKIKQRDPHWLDMAAIAVSFGAISAQIDG